MKLSQQQPREVGHKSHLTRASSTFADSTSTLFDPNPDFATIYASDLSSLVNASHVSHAIASSYHALTTQALLKHNKRYLPPHQSDVDLDTSRAQHTSQISASLEDFHVNLSRHLPTNSTQSHVDTTPMDYFEAYPSSQYQQLGNYHSLADSHSGFNGLRATAQDSKECNESMRAEFGTQGQSHGGLTYWVPDRERYMYVRTHDWDMTDWGEDLLGVGTQFDAQAHSEEATPNGAVCEEGFDTT
ncbi:hypothetical protein BKA64DRAFT_642308 [Cadophora sp. MPI-SDFR-AT-0126]|nr:hypothetical protein BKA64DRAFT_642308 [Leotiomycetes sp. MPI-SDFR-AT-0126]